MFNPDLQKSAAKYLDSKTRLNDFYFALGWGAVILAILYGSKAIALAQKVFGF